MSESPNERPVDLATLALSPRVQLPLSGLRMSERKLLLAVGDIFLLNAALILSLWLRTDLLPEWRAVFAVYKWFVTLIVVWGVMAAVFDVYNLVRAASTSCSVRATLGAAAGSAGIYLLIPWLTPRCKIAPRDSSSSPSPCCLSSAGALSTRRFLCNPPFSGAPWS